jgi:hypothetical protein
MRAVEETLLDRGQNLFHGQLPNELDDVVQWHPEVSISRPNIRPRTVFLQGSPVMNSSGIASPMTIVCRALGAKFLKIELERILD